MTKPPPVPGGKYWWEPPPEHSERCTYWLDRLDRGLWRPTEDTIWRREDDAVKRAGVWAWEWRRLIVPAFCARAAGRPDCPWPVERLPHCPDQYLTATADRYQPSDRWITGVCQCPEPEPGRWHASLRPVHWVTRDGARMYCHCGPREEPYGSGLVMESISGGYVCETCAPRLLTKRHEYPYTGRTIREAGRVGEGWEWSHRLKCDCRCCYCGGVAKEGCGWRLDNGHPPTAVVEPAD